MRDERRKPGILLDRKETPYLRCIDDLPPDAVTRGASRTNGPSGAQTWKSRVHYQRTIWWVFLGLVAVVAGLPMLSSQTALAQSWLPWASTREREEPRRRPPPRRQPAPNYGEARPSVNGSQGYGDRPPICLQLEQRLALDAQNQSGAQGVIQKLRADLRAARRDLARADRELDRRSCYETFLFTRSLRPSRTCHRLDRQSRDAGRRAEDFAAQLRSLQDRGLRRERQDEIVRALARNNCGANYQREARRRDPFTNFWNDNDGDSTRGPSNLFGGLPFATYRTVCVRLCDGYYFPVSFSTLPTHFTRDNDACQSKCAAPTELYFHQNPGGSVDQMVSQRTQQPYSTLRTAFRYRKEFVQGCSCKKSEFVPQNGAAPAAVSPVPPTTSSVTPSNKLSPVR